MAHFTVSAPGGTLSGQRSDPDQPPDQPVGPPRPLLVAVHGGGYSSRYFSMPGYSLLDRGAAAGCTTVAFDRPGYGESTLPDLEFVDSALELNAEIVAAGIDEVWRAEQRRSAGVVLIGHSIGGAIVAIMAGATHSWPLLGIAVSGVARLLSPGVPGHADADPTSTHVVVPDEVKNASMFGPAEGYDADAAALATQANAPVAYRELMEIHTQWSRRADAVFAGVRAPVHYRIGEHDVMWAPRGNDVENMRRVLLNAPRVDAAVVPGVGHAIDFHRVGPALQSSQIDFAIGCAAAGREP